MQTHAQAATVAAVATQGAARVMADAALTTARTECPDTPDDDADRACIARVRERWAPADPMVGSLRITLLAWVEALEIAHMAGSQNDLWVPLATAAARFVVEYQHMAEWVRELGVDMPALPRLIVNVAGLLGGSGAN